VWDHVVVGDGVPVADHWVTLGAVGQATRRLRIGPMVAGLPPPSGESIDDIRRWVSAGPTNYVFRDR
jgi:hypothetical protein